MERVPPTRMALLAKRSQIRLVEQGRDLLIVPPVNRALPARGYALTGATPRIDAATEAFESLLDLGLRLATQEMKLRRLSQEIRLTTRRINVLDQEVLPRLRAERERGTIFRLKRLIVIHRAREEV